MSKLDGGIFSNPSGKTAGIVFGAARTRQGKKVTARQLVSPSNPRTTAQQQQRGKFGDSLKIVRFLGADIYQNDFNRAISQLPGFQSMMSIYMNAMDSSKTLSEPPAVNLGTLHLPETISIHKGTTTSVAISYSLELGDNGTTDDTVVAFAVDVSSAGRATLIGGMSYEADIRDSESTSIDNLTDSHTYLVGFYLRGAGDASGLLSQCVWEVVDLS